MALTNPKNVVTEERLNEYHQTILPYLGGNSMVACGGGYAPIGTVIAYMGTRAPSDFLICDGTVYNIADYTELADFFELQFGNANFFGGDGATTFAVPDLRGEFLRGTGTNSHANQGSGANVGVHQDGTSVPIAMADNSNMNIAYGDGSISETILDTVFHVDAKIESGGFRYIQGTSQSYDNDARTKNFTSRPTNTSVLYCIKAKSQGNGYSLDEQIVGTWIDGKPIYQKTFMCTSTTRISQATWTAINNAFSEMTTDFVSAIDSIISSCSSVDKKCYDSRFVVMTNYPSVGQLGVYVTGGNPEFSAGSGFITLQYTKIAN